MTKFLYDFVSKNHSYLRYAYYTVKWLLDNLRMNATVIFSSFVDTTYNVHHNKKIFFLCSVTRLYK